MRDWCPKQAQELRDERRKQCVNAQRLSLLDWTEVERLVRLDMSPEQAARRLALESVLQISHETIYLRIYADKRRGGGLWRHLRCQKPRRKRYASSQERRGMIKNRTSLGECPEIVDQKNRIGDWEGGTVIGMIITEQEHSDQQEKTALQYYMPKNRCKRTKRRVAQMLQRSINSPMILIKGYWRRQKHWQSISRKPSSNTAWPGKCWVLFIITNSIWQKRVRHLKKAMSALIVETDFLVRERPGDQ